MHPILANVAIVKCVWGVGVCGKHCACYTSVSAHIHNLWRHTENALCTECVVLEVTCALSSYG